MFVLFADVEGVFISILNVIKQGNLTLNKQILGSKGLLPIRLKHSENVWKQFDLKKRGKTGSIAYFHNFDIN